MKPQLRPQLYDQIRGVCINRKCNPIRINGVEDHVHIFCHLSKEISTADLIRDIKRSSSYWIKHIDPTLGDFNWQSGYGAFNIGNSQREALIKYINHQEEHPKHWSFEDEFKSLLKKYNLSFNEKYFLE